ncbi:NAD(P)/FAD-dependent oxidoreductase [Halocalculus aciditolerans]|uniref:Sarcosine oxidase n=1 Tax=Halocalculus aciditolerans TaxID=1383812 RepID=A0A830FQW9_9EURY|nr:FAD-dependent oxidoreductase [Halocalculus aciditolerans]GGL72459.1 sarcosine oxidase [Halocalculus aciditolerans]
MTVSVAVVGAGAVGLTAAYDLAEAGADVTVFERETVGAGSSGRAAGVLYDAYSDAVDARIADRALDRFRAFSGRGDFAFHETPYVQFATDAERADVIEETVFHLQAQDRDVSVISRDDLEREFPHVDWSDVEGAMVARNAGYADPATYPALLADLARERGVDVRERTPAELTLDPTAVNGDPFDAVAVAAGAHTKQVLADAGLSVPLKPYRVQALVATGPPVPMFHDATAGYYARPHPQGILAGDGTEPREFDPDDWNREGDGWFEARTLAALRERLRGDISLHRSWAGLCVATPDGDPLLGELADGVYVAAGWQGHGFMRAPATGEALADAVLGRDGIDVAPFDPARFDGDESFAIREGMDIG